MHGRNRMLAALLGAWSLVTAANATTYVVDNRSPSAADTNPGTREAPFRTVSAAAARAVAGDEVVVRPGIYRESVALTNSGAPGRPIVFRSEEPLQAVISGSDVVSDWQPEGPGVWSRRAPNLRPNAYAIPHNLRGGEWVYVDGAPLQYAAERDRLTAGTFHLDFAARRLYVALSEETDADRARIEYATRDGLIWPARPLDDIHVSGFTLLHNADWFRGRSALQVSGRRWRVEGNRIAWASYVGLRTVGSLDAIVRSNLVEWCGNTGVGGARNMRLRFENNVVRCNDWKRSGDLVGEGGGSKWCASIDSCVLNNHWYANHSMGVWFDFANGDNVIASNVVHDNTGPALFSEFNWHTIVRDNIAYNNLSYGVSLAQNQGSVALHNIVFNNDIGLLIRGLGRNWTPEQIAAFPPEKLREEAQRMLRDIPGVEPLTIDRWEAGYLKLVFAPPAEQSNNNVFWENVVFDNRSCNYFEYRRYGVPSPRDVHVNNFSDHNVWHALGPAAGFQYGGGSYPDGLAGWQLASGRDGHSIEADPHTATNLPAWVQARRALWDFPVRPLAELRTLGLVDGPEGQLARMRISRSATLTNLVLRESRIRAYRFEVDGESVLGVWTTNPLERRYLRLKLSQARVTLENAYLEKQPRVLVDGALDLVATHLPTYLRGIGAQIEEVPASGLTAPMLNAVGAAVPVTATFVNNGSAPMPVAAAFTPGAGFRAEPERIERSVAPGTTETAIVQVRPAGAPRKGIGRVLMDATLGRERLRRAVSFGVGEGEGVVPQAPATIVVDGKLKDWGGLVTTGMPVGGVVDPRQCAGGDVKLWKGPADLSGKVYAAWTPQMLYVAIVVTDDAIVPALPGGTPWDVDAVELFVDGRGFDMQWQKEPTEGCYQIGVSPAKGAVPANTQVYQKSVAGLQTGTSLTETGYIVEIGIPLTDRNFPAGDWKPGRPVRFSVMFSDKDDPATPGRKCCFGWAHSPGGANYNDTSGWQTLSLK